MLTRVLMVTPSYPRDGDVMSGGVASACHGLAHALSRHPDVSVTVLVARLAATAMEQAERDAHDGAVRVIRLAERRHRWPAADVLWRTNRIVARSIRSVPHDVLHVHDLERFAAGQRGRNPLLTAHGFAELDARYRGSGLTRRLRQAILGVLCRRARRSVPNLIAVNPYVLDRIQPLHHQRAWAIPNAVRPEYFAVRRSPQRGRVLVSGRVTPLKNVHGAIRCFASLAQSDADCELIVAGGGDAGYASFCKELARKLGVGGRVGFLGHLDHRSLGRELAACQFLLLCSLQENAPMAISEAMAAATPVVAADVGGTRHMVQHGVTGLVARYDDDASLADCMRVMLASPEEALEMGIRGREIARRTYHPDVIASLTLDAYRTIMSGAADAGRARS